MLYRITIAREIHLRVLNQQVSLRTVNLKKSLPTSFESLTTILTIDPHEEILGSSTDLDHENHQAGSRPEVDRGTAGRFIQHSITRAVPKRRLEEDEIEERLESGRAAPRAKLPEIRQVIKAGGWADEDESE